MSVNPRLGGRGLLSGPGPPLALLAPPIRSSPPATDGRPIRRLSQSEMEERRRLGLCFNCNEKFARSHNRVCQRIFLLDLADDDEEAATDDEPHQSPLISLLAMAGVWTWEMMQVHIQLGGNRLLALLDSGSTHNFVSSEAAGRTSLKLNPRGNMNVTVANGEKVPCPGVYRNVPFTIDGESFTTNFFALPLARYDVVLETEWLASLGPILWDFRALTMSFWHHDHRVCWTGVAESRAPSVRVCSSYDLFPALLEEFTPVFAEPSGMPPPRHRDHCINLLPGSTPMAMRPYHYPAAHKDELERQCATMLSQGIIQHSSSAFSSPVLLVKKADGSWRFCIDYRALNAITVKDAYPIPVVDELLDELHGARYFTKLDLRSGYHQVRMRLGDVEKTAFRTHDGLYEFLVMPLGLCNAPATFQALMNDILRPFLRCFVLVFFNDILIYSNSITEHLRHLCTVLTVLLQHQLFVKKSKCDFSVSSISYLAHIISVDGVAMDPEKVRAVTEWPQPRSARAIRGFLGLAGYYRKFIKNFGTIAAPLTALLKKVGFIWTNVTSSAFEELKTAITIAPILAMPNFRQPFVVECDASTHGFGIVLIQDSHPVAFFSRPAAPRHLSLAAYEKELIGLVLAIRHWRPYLWGRRFMVRIDHFSLKFLLDRRLATIPQHHWVGKLLGFDFSVEYKPDSSNTVADALSRRDTEESAILAISRPRFEFIDRLRLAHDQEPALVALKEEIANDLHMAPWSLIDGMVAFQGHLYILPDAPLLQELITTIHEDGHQGVQRTLHRLRRDFHSPNLRSVVQAFIRNCATCQRYKSEHLHPAGLLLPLPVPAAVWADIGMDFVEALPKVGGKSVILTVVDRFHKHCHFIPLGHPYSAKSVAQAFYTEIVRLHGIPQSIISDWDPVFTSLFWKELMRLACIKLHMSSAFHPQSNGQTEAANKVIIMYLRCFTGDRPRQWLRWLPWAEFIYNTAFQSALKTTQFRIVYGRDPPTIRSYEQRETRVASVAKSMTERDEFLADARSHLKQAQAVYKCFYDKNHRDLCFTVGDWVWLRLRHHTPASLWGSPVASFILTFMGPTASPP
jgi:transposase InsO family protein